MESIKGLFQLIEILRDRIKRLENQVAKHINGGPLPCPGNTNMGQGVAADPVQKPWQCYLSERDWAIIFYSWDNASPLEKGIRDFKEYEEVAKKGHFGDCTKDAETCQACTVENSFRSGKEMANKWKEYTQQ
jgi:hypothetical protein